MEQQRKGLVVAQNAQSALAHRRAMELGAKHPQLMEYEPELPAEIMKGSGMSGGEAGLRRVIGAGKKKKAAEPEVEYEEESSSDEEGAKAQAKMLAEHLGKKHGGAYMAKFAKAMAKGGRMYQVAHNVESGVGLPGSGTGGQDVPPGGEAPITYGNVPQAPASFKRNTVGMGAPAGGAMTGGFWGAIASLAAPLLGKLLGSGDLTEDAHAAIMGGAKHGEAEMAKAMMKAMEDGKMSKKAHAAMVKKLQGKGFLSNLGIPVVSDIARVFGLGRAGAGAAAGGASAGPRARYGDKDLPLLPAHGGRAAGGGELHIVHKGMGRAGAGRSGGAAPAGGAKKPSARGALIKKVMADQGCSMIEASKYIKEHGLKA